MLKTELVDELAKERARTALSRVAWMRLVRESGLGSMEVGRCSAHRGGGDSYSLWQCPVEYPRLSDWSADGCPWVTEHSGHGAVSGNGEVSFDIHRAVEGVIEIV